MSIDKRLFIFLSVAFIVATIVGTLTHELGHYFLAEALGYDASINYNSTFPALSNSKSLTEKNNFLITLGGPLETMLTGTIGLVLLFVFRKSFQTAQLSITQWLMIFISLFWLRQTANFLVWIAGWFVNDQMSNRSDEFRLARYLQLPSWSISLLTATIGGSVLIIVIFKFIPLQQRMTFIMSGLVGGISGYILWMYYLGPIVLP